MSPENSILPFPYRLAAGLGKLGLPIVLVGALLAPGIALAEQVPSKAASQLTAAVNVHTGLQVHPDVATTPVPGIFEVVVDGELLYTDATGRYAFVGGALMDLKDRKDLTAAHNEKRMAIPFEKLPLQHALKEVRGDGRKVFAVFEDPNCPICRVFTKFIDQLDNVTVYRFMFPVISPQSQSLARMAWCSSDRVGVWKALMEGARPKLSESCDTNGLVQILAAGERFQINNTPTVVLANGKRLVGATPPELFIEELEKSAQGRRK
jgi:thiol:disulfide interchange protein DsbC